MRLARVTFVLLLLTAGTAFADKSVSVKTVYNDDTDTFRTRGQVTLDVPLQSVTEVAGKLNEYRRWALREINTKANGKSFIIQLRDLSHTSGGPFGHGLFRLKYDVDLVWPFGSKNQHIDFAVLDVNPNPKGGLDRLTVALHGPNKIIKTFSLVLIAFGDEKRAVVDFEAQVQLTGFIDTFFPLSVYRRNIEYRIVKVIRNLKVFLRAKMPK